MRSLTKLSCVIAALVAWATPVAAQTAEREVVAVVEKLFDAMRTRDTVALRAVFDSTARLVRVDARGGTPRVQITSVNEFVSIIGKATGDAWNERIYNPEVRIDGSIAQVWTTYTFHRGTTFSHCGIDAFQLAKLSGGWKVVHLADTFRREGCPTATDKN